MGEGILRQIEQFLYREARLLDERRFHQWLDLFTDDVHYWMPGRTTRYAKISKSLVILDEDRYEEEELGKEEELALLDEDKQSLRMRIARLETGMAWAEDPPSRTCHLITNIEVEDGEVSSRLSVYSAFIVYRNRGETEQDVFVGRREDTLRQIDGAWKIARRKIILNQSVLLAKNISIFF
ncbi:MAG: 3-phenylpropionate/cinnamic acid dioxygenase subunit beta [Candidatus Tectomicrobia bacterium]